MLTDFVNLFFPPLCYSCEMALSRKEHFLCLNCQINLPRTNFHLDKNNPVTKMFWGRVPIEMGASLYYFNKKSNVQRLLHHIKYKGGKELAMHLGRVYGKNLKHAAYFDKVDAIVPVPIHIRKKRKRGYNQSDCIAKGMAETMNIPVYENVLYQKKEISSQTSRSRYGRWENVHFNFAVRNEHLLDQKTIMVVDDVLTTAATLEACVRALNEVVDCKVVVATLAYAALR